MGQEHSVLRGQRDNGKSTYIYILVPVTVNERCNNTLASSDGQSAGILVKEIVSVFRADFRGIIQGLDMYAPAFLVGQNAVDYLADLRLLRARLQKELDALEPRVSAEEQLPKREKKNFISHAT